MRVVILIIACMLAVDGDYLKARIAIALKLNQPAPVAIEKRKQRVEIWTATWCKPCKQIKADVDAGKWSEFDVTIRDYDSDKPPANMSWLPAIAWDRAGQRVIFPHDKTSERDAIYDRSKWQQMVTKQ